MTSSLCLVKRCFFLPCNTSKGSLCSRHPFFVVLKQFFVTMCETAEWHAPLERPPGAGFLGLVHLSVDSEESLYLAEEGCETVLSAFCSVSVVHAVLLMGHAVLKNPTASLWALIWPIFICKALTENNSVCAFWTLKKYTENSIRGA